MCLRRLERVSARSGRGSRPLDASVSAMIAWYLIFGAAAFAGLCAGVSDLFSHIEQIDSGLPANRGRILKDLVMILVPAFFRGFAAHAFVIFAYHISQFELAAPTVQTPRFQRRGDAETQNETGSIIWTIQ